MKKILTLTLMLVTLFAINLYAEGETDTSTSTSGDSVTVTIGLFPDLNTSIEAVCETPEFKEKFPNVKVQINSLDWEGHHNRLVTVISAGEGANDIEVIDEGYLGTFMSGGFSDLSVAPYNAKEISDDLIQYAIKNATNASGELIALPIDSSPTVLFYRKSIVDAAGVSLDDLPSWDAYINAAVKLTKDTDGDGVIDQYALANAYELSLIPLNNGVGSWIDGSVVMEPAKKYKDLLTIVKQLEDLGVHGNWNEWTDPWIEGYSNGATVTANIGGWFLGSLSTWMCPELSGDWRVARLPANTYCNYGGSFVGIPENTDADKKASAWEVLKYLTTDPNAQLTSLRAIGSFPSLTTVYNDAAIDEPIEYLGGQKAYQIYAETVKNIPIIDPSEYDQVAKTIWENVVAGIVEGSLTIDEAYETAKNNLIAVMD